MAASCVICHELLSSGDKSCAAKCGHVLHNSCWEQWLKRKPECPECRVSTTKEDLILLFFNQEDSNNRIDLPANDIDSLSSDIQNLNITRNPKSFKEEQPELLDLGDSEDQDSFYLEESESDVAVVEESEDFGSPPLRSDDESIIETSDESETDVSARADGASSSCGTGSEDSDSDETESEELGSDQSGSEADEAGSEGSSGDEDSATGSDIFLSNGSGDDEDVEATEEESGSYETGSALESDISTVSTDGTTESDN